MEVPVGSVHVARYAATQGVAILVGSRTAPEVASPSCKVHIDPIVPDEGALGVVGVVVGAKVRWIRSDVERSTRSCATETRDDIVLNRDVIVRESGDVVVTVVCDEDTRPTATASIISLKLSVNGIVDDIDRTCGR